MRQQMLQQKKPERIKEQGPPMAGLDRNEDLQTNFRVRAFILDSFPMVAIPLTAVQGLVAVAPILRTQQANADGLAPSGMAFWPSGYAGGLGGYTSGFHLAA
jgi:hypothetical protein